MSGRGQAGLGRARHGSRQREDRGTERLGVAWRAWARHGTWRGATRHGLASLGAEHGRLKLKHRRYYP